MAQRVDEVRGTKVVLRFEAKRCIHSRNCVLGRPEVFIPNSPGQWMHPDASSAEAVVAVALSCPSGAITYQRLDGGEQEQPPPVNLVRVRENGPLAFHADIRLEGAEPRFRATLCRCGASGSKPFCDNAHSRAGFTATGEPATQDSPALKERAGPLSVTPLPNGPLLVAGNVEVVSGTGRTVLRTQKAAFCRCGASANKPFCDGSHARVGFHSEPG
ncbi:MAG: CDGSH iron-sulfur domain-containing protein [Myxococcaceae bacterium]